MGPQPSFPDSQKHRVLCTSGDSARSLRHVLRSLDKPVASWIHVEYPYVKSGLRIVGLLESCFPGLQALAAVRRCQTGSTSLVDEDTKTGQVQAQPEG